MVGIINMNVLVAGSIAELSFAVMIGNGFIILMNVMELMVSGALIQQSVMFAVVVILPIERIIGII